MPVALFYDLQRREFVRSATDSRPADTRQYAAGKQYDFSIQAGYSTGDPIAPYTVEALTGATLSISQLLVSPRTAEITWLPLANSDAFFLVDDALEGSLTVSSVIAVDANFATAEISLAADLTLASGETIHIETRGTVRNPSFPITPPPGAGYPPAEDLLTAADFGTTTGTVAAGDDARITDVGLTGVMVRGADPAGGGDASAAILNAVSRLPSGGGRLIVPSGLFSVTSLPTLNKKIVMQGAGAGATTLTTTSTTQGIFNVTVDRCAFLDLTFAGPITTPTAGALITFSAGLGAHIARCSLQGGWQGIEFINGVGWSIADCDFYRQRKYGVKINNLSNYDGGDSALSNTGFSSDAAAASSAAIYQESSGGLKMTNVKVVGPAYGAPNGFLHGYWLNLPDVVGTSIVLVTGCSFENVRGWGCIVSNAGPANGGYFKKINISGANEFGYCGAGAIKIGDYAGAAALNIGDCEVSGNVIDDCPIGVMIDNCLGGHVGKNWYTSATPRGVVVTSVAQGVTVDAQVRGGIGMLIENASALCSADYFHQGIAVFGGTTTLRRLAVPPYSGGLLTISVAGSVAFVGEVTAIMSRLYSRGGSGNVSLAATGTDQLVGPGGITLTIDVASVAGEMQIKASTASGNGFSGTLTVRAAGQLSSFKIGS